MSFEEKHVMKSCSIKLNRKDPSHFSSQMDKKLVSALLAELKSKQWPFQDFGPI